MRPCAHDAVMAGYEALNWHVEHACAAAWPAADEVAIGDWTVRRSGGGTRRTNSASPARAGARIEAATLAGIEASFAEHHLSTIVRVPSFVPGIDAALTDAGYAPPEGATHTLAAQLLPQHRRDPAVTLGRMPDAAWRAARMRLSRAQGGGAHDHVAVIDRLRVPAIFARADVSGETRAVGFVALVGELAVIEAVATDRDHRRRGLARRCVATLLTAAREAGAGTAVLQVVADNVPALALYAQLGFTTHLYDYHYRRSAP